MNTDEKILDRLKTLIEMGDRVLATQHDPGPNVIGDDSGDTQLAYRWATSVQNLLARVFGRDSEHYRNFTAQAGAYLTFSPVYHGQGILRAAKDDYENGHLFELRRLVEAEVFDDFLEQAEHLLAADYYQAAAVLAREEDHCSSKAKAKTTLPNRPFHLTLASLPPIARSAAGERQRSADDREEHWPRSTG